MEITANTKLAGLLGYPVGHSLSPAMHNAAFAELGLDFRYLAFEVPPERLGHAVEAVRALNMAGVNVTVPHKENVIKYLDEVDAEASFIGAVNTIVNDKGRLKGYNTDGRGFMRSLEEEGASAKGRDILIIGAGGASRAVGYYLAKEAGRIVIFDMDRPKAERLAGDLKSVNPRVESAPKMPDAERFGIIINATPLGLKPSDPLPVDAEKIKPSHVCIDLIYKETPFLKEAKSKSAKAVNGLGMLLWQGVLAFELWTGKTPPAKLMRQKLLEGMAR